MRILTVSPFFEAHAGGIEIVAGALVRALANKGYDSRWAAADVDVAPVDLAGRTTPLPSVDPIEHVIGLPMPIPGRKALARLDAEVAAADGIVIHDALYFGSLAAAHLARKHHKPWILIQHIGVIPFRNPMVRAVHRLADRLVSRPLMARAPQVVFISNTVRGHFSGVAWKRPPQLLFNGVDHALFHPPAAKDQPTLRALCGLSSDRPTLLFVGRFVEKKGLSIIRELAAMRPDLDFVLIGSGPIDPSLWRLSNVHVRGRKSRKEVAEYCQACDALVLPSTGEGYPLVVQEALATGLPVFCGDETARADPGASAFMTGVQIDLRQPARTAATLAGLIDPNGWHDRQMSAQYCEKVYDWTANAGWIGMTLNLLADAVETARQP